MLELVPTLFDGEKSGDSSESREYSEIPKEGSSSNGEGRVARDERPIANVWFFSFRYFVTRREFYFYSGARFSAPSDNKKACFLTACSLEKIVMTRAVKAAEDLHAGCEKTKKETRLRLRCTQIID